MARSIRIGRGKRTGMSKSSPGQRMTPRKDRARVVSNQTLRVSRGRATPKPRGYGY